MCIVPAIIMAEITAEGALVIPPAGAEKVPLVGPALEVSRGVLSARRIIREATIHSFG